MENHRLPDSSCAHCGHHKILRGQPLTSLRVRLLAGRFDWGGDFDQALSGRSLGQHDRTPGPSGRVPRLGLVPTTADAEGQFTVEWRSTTLPSRPSGGQSHRLSAA
jgi:hypothetical protein